MDFQTSLRLSPEIFHAICRHAAADYPNEACGLLIGQGMRVTAAIATPNVSATPQDRFAIDPADFRAAEAGTTGVIGVYHSHPDAAARPSSTDLGFAQNTIWGYAYLIVAVWAGRIAGHAAFVLDDDGAAFVEIPVEFV